MCDMNIFVIIPPLNIVVGKQRKTKSFKFPKLKKWKKDGFNIKGLMIYLAKI